MAVPVQWDRVADLLVLVFPILGKVENGKDGKSEWTVSAQVYQLWRLSEIVGMSVRVSESMCVCALSVSECAYVCARCVLSPCLPVRHDVIPAT